MAGGLGCSGATVEPPSDETAVSARVRAQYPAADFLTAEGEGPDRAAAEQRARVRVAEQVSGRLAATTTVREGEADGQQRHAVRSEVQTATRFERLELIEVVPEASRCLAPQRCVAFAVLDRTRALKVLSADLDAAHTDFARAADRAEAIVAAPPPAPRPGPAPAPEPAPEPASAPAAEPDDRALTTALADAAEALRRVELHAAPLVAIGGGLPASVVADRARAGRLAALRDARLARLVVHLDADDLDPELQAPVTQALVQAFGTLGLTARPSGTCAAGLRFRPQGAVSCGRSALGPRCQLNLTGALSTCGGAGVSRLDLGPGVQAVHPRSAEEARRKLLGALPAAALARGLRGALDGVLPIRPAP